MALDDELKRIRRDVEDIADSVASITRQLNAIGQQVKSDSAKDAALFRLSETEKPGASPERGRTFAASETIAPTPDAQKSSGSPGLCRPCRFLSPRVRRVRISGQ